MKVVVLVTDPKKYDIAVDWLVDHANGRPVSAHVLVAASDNPGAPQFVSHERVAAIREAFRVESVTATVQPVTEHAGDLTLRAIATHDATLAIVSIQARSSTGKLVLGSHGRRVVTEASCPVVTIKHEAD